MKKAIVTLTIGESFEKMFNELCKENWEVYCKKFDYTLITINTPLDTTERAKLRSPSWQKLLILKQDWAKEYDRIVWVDSDVLINSQYAYDIIEGVPEEMVGAVDAYSIPSREIFNIGIERMYASWTKNNIKFVDNIKPSQYYTNRGLPGESLDNVIQAGVFVCSPAYHKEIFEYVYNHYEDHRGNEYNYENPPLSFELLKANKIHWISCRFNFCVAELMASFYPDSIVSNSTKKNFFVRVSNKIKSIIGIKNINKQELAILENIYDLSIFMHFAGSANKMYLMKDIINKHK